MMLFVALLATTAPAFAAPRTPAAAKSWKVASSAAGQACIDAVVKRLKEQSSNFDVDAPATIPECPGSLNLTAPLRVNPRPNNEIFVAAPDPQTAAAAGGASSIRVDIGGLADSLGLPVPQGVGFTGKKVTYVRKF